MTPTQLITHYGSQAAVADAAELTDTAIGHWVKQGWIPYDKQDFFEHDSAGQLKASWLDLPAEKRPKHLREATAE